jgi:hypothetical protein
MLLLLCRHGSPRTPAGDAVLMRACGHVKRSRLGWSLHMRRPMRPPERDGCVRGSCVRQTQAREHGPTLASRIGRPGASKSVFLLITSLATLRIQNL